MMIAIRQAAWSTLNFFRGFNLDMNQTNLCPDCYNFLVIVQEPKAAAVAKDAKAPKGEEKPQKKKGGKKAEK